MEIVSSLGVAYATYLVGILSPGPANLAIISTSLSHGRSAGVATAIGVVSGSVIWGVTSAFGLGALLARWPALINALSLFGGFYLCFLAWGAARKAISGAAPQLSRDAKTDSTAKKKFFFYGIALHLTNPKAMFVWMSIIALGLPKDTEEFLIPLLIVAGCAVIGVCVFVGYALVFSNEKMAKLYIRASRPINSLIAALFLVAGLGLFYRSAVLLIAV